MGITPAPWYNRPILYMSLVRLLVRLFGPSELVLRLFPCLAGLAAIVATWVLARRELGERFAFPAAILLAVSPAFLYEAHQVKHYTLDVLFTCLILLAYATYRRSRSARNLAIYALTAIVSFGFSFTSVFVVAAVTIVESVPLAREVMRQYGSGRGAGLRSSGSGKPLADGSRGTGEGRESLVRLNAGDRGAEVPEERTAFGSQDLAPGRRDPAPPRARRLWAFPLATLVLGAVFVVVYRAFHASAGADAFLTEYFVDAWLPLGSPLSFPFWLARQTAVLAEIAGAGSFVAMGLVLAAGAWWDLRRGSGLISSILALGLLINLAASAAHIYPYGSARLMLFLAPLVSALLAAGILPVLVPGEPAGNADRAARGPIVSAPASVPDAMRGAGAAAHADSADPTFKAGLLDRAMQAPGPWLRALPVLGLLYLFFYPALMHARPYLGPGWGTDELRRLVGTLAAERHTGEGILVAERAGPSFSYYWYRSGQGTDDTGVVWGERHRLHPEEHAIQIAAVADRYDRLWVLFYDQSREERGVLRELLLKRYDSAGRRGEREASSLELFKRKAARR